jgi:hypothetical protein
VRRLNIPTDITITMHGGSVIPDSSNVCWRSLVVSSLLKRLGHNFFISFSDEEYNVSETLCCCTQILHNYNLNAITTIIIFTVGN